MRLDDLKKEIEVLKVKHEADKDLGHEIGTDRDCMYCDEYKKMVKKLNLYKPERLRNRTRRKKELYEISLSNGEKYMVYAESLEESAKLLGVDKSSFVRKTIIQKKYWEGILVEVGRGDLVTAKQLLKTNQSKKVARYEISKNKNVRQYCYNDTPIEYLIYEKDYLNLLERFVSPYEIVLTKKFERTGRINIPTAYGSLGVSPDDVLLKITKKLFVVISKEEFTANFSKEENYSWTEF